MQHHAKMSKTSKIKELVISESRDEGAQKPLFKHY